MRVEVPQFTKCCFCIPLRRGLLFWGYFKLMTTLLYLGILLFASVSVIYSRTEIIIVMFAIVVCLVDVSFSVAFIVGAHKKNYKLLRVYYYFSMSLLAIYSLLFVLYAGLQCWIYSTRSSYLTPGVIISALVKEASIFFLDVVVQMYLLFLIRSEVIKLKSSCRFQFTNTIADAQCELTDENGKIVF